jgi:uncharacterized repeat protein (TIGR01451 family)
VANFTGDVKLTFEKISFRQDGCDNSGCETLGGANSDVLSATGLSIGNKNVNQHGNIIVYFKVIDNTAVVTPTTPGSTSSGSSGSRSSKTCRDERALNYKAYGTHRESVCEYKTSVSPVDSSSDSSIENPIPNTRVVRIINYKYVEVDYFRDIILEKKVSLRKDTGYGLRVNADTGDDIYYKFVVTNNSDKEISNLNITDTISESLELIELNDNTSYDDKKKEVS